MLSIGRTTMCHKLVGAGEIEVVRIGPDRNGVPVAALEEYVDRQRRPGVAGRAGRRSTDGIREPPHRPPRANWYDSLRCRTPRQGDVWHSKTFAARKEASGSANTVEAEPAPGAFVDPRLRARHPQRSRPPEWLGPRPNLRARGRETYESQLRLHIRPTTGDGIELGKIGLGELTAGDRPRVAGAALDPAHA